MKVGKIVIYKFSYTFLFKYKFYMDEIYSTNKTRYNELRNLVEL